MEQHFVHINALILVGSYVKLIILYANLLIADLDYLCLSPHKNLGGSEATGVLIGKKSSYKLLCPSFPGGGTVLVIIY